MRNLHRVFVLLLVADVSWAAMGGDSSASRLDQAIVDPETWALNPMPEKVEKVVPGTTFDVLAGASVFKGETGIALAVRGPIANSFRWELGGVVPHQVSGYASDGATFVGSPQTETASARVRTFGEVHAVALYPFYQAPRSPGHPGITVDTGVGVSLAFLKNEIDEEFTGGPYPGTNAEHDTPARISPRLQLGVAAALTYRLSVRLDVAWVDYSNNDSFGAHNFNLGFSGIMIEPMLQIRI